MNLRTSILIVGIFAAGISLWSSTAESAQAARVKFTRPAMLESMAVHCIARGVHELAVSATNLSAATQQLVQAPDANTLAFAQQAWIEFQHTYKRNQMLGHGPVKDPAFWTSMFYHQALPMAVENVVRSQRPIDADLIEVLGSSARGFYALEYLLFDLSLGPTTIIGQTNGTPRLSARLLLEGATAERRRVYVRALALDLQARLRAADHDAHTAGFVGQFSSGAQDSVNLVVNQVIDSVESGLLLPLNNCLLQHQSGGLRYNAILGNASGTPVSAFKAILEGAERYYKGGDNVGIDDYVRHVNPELASRVEAQFKVAAAAFDALGNSLDEAFLLRLPAVEKALEEGRKLELLLKVDAVSALGVTIMFNANDGD